MFAEYGNRDLGEGRARVVDHCSTGAREAIVDGEGHIGKLWDWLSFVRHNGDFRCGQSIVDG